MKKPQVDASDLKTGFTERVRKGPKTVVFLIIRENVSRFVTKAQLAAGAPARSVKATFPNQLPAQPFTEKMFAKSYNLLY